MTPEETKRLDEIKRDTDESEAMREYRAWVRAGLELLPILEAEDQRLVARLLPVRAALKTLPGGEP